jgi:hypothetical protein
MSSEISVKFSPSEDVATPQPPSQQPFRYALNHRTNVLSALL